MLKIRKNDLNKSFSDPERFTMYSPNEIGTTSTGLTVRGPLVPVTGFFFLSITDLQGEYNLDISI